MSNHARRVRLLGAAGVVLLIAGVIAIVIGLRGQHHAPQPPAAAASPVEVTPTLADGHETRLRHTPADRCSPAAAPTRLDVPAIGVHTSLKRIGLTAAGMIQTPPLDRDSHAYWLTVSPTPGQLGPATIIGHVDSAAYGPGVFFRLGGLAATRHDLDHPGGRNGRGLPGRARRASTRKPSSRPRRCTEISITPG